MYLPADSRPLAAAVPAFRLAASRASFVPSTTDFETKGDVVKARARHNGKAFEGNTLKNDIFVAWNYRM